MRMILAFGVTAALMSCSRPESPEYFSDITGLKVCNDMRIINVNAHAENRSPGFDSVYIVKVYGTKNCLEMTYNSASLILEKKCNFNHVCSGVTKQGIFLSLEPQANGSLLVTHST